RALPLPPRLARIVLAGASSDAATLAADVALVMTERGLGGSDIDLTHRLETLRRDRSAPAHEARAIAKRWAETASATPVIDSRRASAPEGREKNISPGALVAHAYPDRVARRRSAGGFLLANGRGAQVEPTSALAREPFLAVAEVTGSAAQGRILLAAPITLA